LFVVIVCLFLCVWNRLSQSTAAALEPDEHPPINSINRVGAGFAAPQHDADI
jgi:hypothetical protein